MRRFNNQIFKILLLAVIVSLNFACEKSSAQLDETKPSQISSPAKQEQVKDLEPYEKEPTGDLGMSEYTKGLKTAWQNFTASGQYRLALFSEMTFNDAARRSLAENFGADRKPLPYTYAWGNLGYKKRPSESHLAAIVVDTTRKDANRFSLVIFSPTKGKKDLYVVHWMYRNRDLSKATVSRLSGSLSVEEYLDNGSRKGCYVWWKDEREEFECV